MAQLGGQVFKVVSEQAGRSAHVGLAEVVVYLGLNFPAVSNPGAGQFQNMSLSANCINRGGAAVTIFPKLDEFKSATGKPKLAWLTRLKDSARN